MGESKQAGEALKSFAKTAFRDMALGRMSYNSLLFEALAALTVSDEKQNGRAADCQAETVPRKTSVPQQPQARRACTHSLPLHQHLIWKASLLRAWSRLLISKFECSSLKLASKVHLKVFFQVSRKPVCKEPTYIAGTVLSTLIYQESSSFIKKDTKAQRTEVSHPRPHRM